MNENQAEFKGFAKVEVMGHQHHTGWVTTEAYGQAVMFRIDRPEIPEHEETLTQYEWVGEMRCPPGTVVKRAKVEALTVLVGAGSIYRIIPCNEAVAMKSIESEERRPLSVVKLPENAQIAAAAAGSDPYDSTDNDPDEEDEDPFDSRKPQY